MPAIHISLRERSLLGRIAYAILALALVVLGLFFLAAAVVAGGLLAAVLLARVWWIKRKMMKEAESQILTAEYTVVKRESQARTRLRSEDRKGPDE